MLISITEFLYIEPKIYIKLPTQKYIAVKVTCYYPHAGYDDPEYMTASGKDITKYETSMRYCAISRDLQKYYNFGDTIHINGIGKWSGNWIVQDLMNKRFKNKIDLLFDATEKTSRWQTARILQP